MYRSATTRTGMMMPWAMVMSHGRAALGSA